VRVGTQQELPERMAQRRQALDLPDSAPLTLEPPLTPERSARTWVGGGGFGSNANYRVGESCSGDYTLYDRTAGGGWLQAEREIPATPTSVWWIGGRASALYESQTKTVHTGSGGSDYLQRYALDTYQGQLWAEWEHPNLTLGLGALAGLENRHAEGMRREMTTFLKPSVRLRAGASFLGIDGGFCDRQYLAGPMAGHIGLSGSIGWGGKRIRHPDDTAFRYFVGGVVVPGADQSLGRFMLSGGLEVFLSPRMAVGFQGGGGDGGFGLGYVRAAVSP
jgi:hypothetical protein